MSTGVEVTGYFGHFLDYCFYEVFSYTLKLCKDCTRKLNSLSGDWSVKVKATSDLFNPMHKQFIELIRK